MKGQNNKVSGFSKMSKADKLQWVARHFFNDHAATMQELKDFWHPDAEQQRILDGFSENTLSNFVLPFGVAPNFLINQKSYCVPMVIEESSVVAAASSAAKFWANRGGFKTEILGTTKVGQLHFSWKGDAQKLQKVFPALQQTLLEDTAHITANMRKRGGGVLDMEWLDLRHLEADYYQIRVKFETCDSMGANFINSVLEAFGRGLQHFMGRQPHFSPAEKEVDIIMAILSNHTPECLVRAWVECPVEDLGGFDGGIQGAAFAEKFRKAVRIAEIDPYRATTHNKGIFNGVDAVVLATANDFRAVEAAGHTYAAQSGQYSSLSHCEIKDDVFRFWLDIPLAIGTVGGLTKLHPLAKRSLEMLGNPSAKELMGIIASVGLAQNFAALRSLITTGIQKGHMKMHLMNILNHLKADPQEVEQAVNYFENRVVSFTAVREFVSALRKAEVKR